MKPMLRIFEGAIKFYYQFLAIFQSSSDLCVSFDKIAPPPLNKRFKICFKSFNEFIPVQRTVAEVLKRDILFILHFDRQASGGL